MEDATEKLDELARSETQCTKCPEITACRLRAVAGGGHPHSTVMFVALAPSPEDEQADQNAGEVLLDSLVAYLPLLSNGARGKAFATTVVKCVPRTADTLRQPTLEEQENCFAYLSREISITTPHYVVPIGEQAARFLVGKLFHDSYADSYEPLLLRVYDSPAFKVVPIASPGEIESMDAKTRRDYTDRLHSLSTVMNA